MHRIQWGDGYCSKECMMADLKKGEAITDYLYAPTGTRVVARTEAQIDAMMEAYETDHRLPKIIYMRIRGCSLQTIADTIEVSKQAVDKILHKLTCKHLARCGLRNK